MKTKILLADDEGDILEFLTYNLEQEGFEVLSASNGVEAIEKLSFHPDLVILDVMMPVMDGFEACRKIRATIGYEKTPIIFLTAKSAEADEITGLNLGANDYIQKPVSPKKLMARIHSNLRKSEFFEEKSPLSEVTIGPLFINREKYAVQLDGTVKVFPRKEFEVLFYLANNPGKVFTREMLLKNVWGTDVYVVDRTVDVHIRKIREKLEAHADLIETVKGIGYRFKSVE